VEDQGGKPTLDIIRARFGERVAEIVSGCTDTDVEPKPLWRERKERYVEHLKSASRSVKLVAAADKLDNANSVIRDYRTHGAEVWTRFRAGAEDQRWFYRACVTALQDGPPSLVGELDAAMQQLEQR
jgi:(p)ppGpp synthase/HD superfamily hydrolase